MSNVKLVFTAIAVILGAFVAFALIGMIVTAIQYLFLLGVIIIAGVIVVKLFGKSNSPQIESRDSIKELKNAERTLEEYKRKYLSK